MDGLGLWRRLSVLSGRFVSTYSAEPFDAARALPDFGTIIEIARFREEGSSLLDGLSIRQPRQFDHVLNTSILKEESSHGEFNAMTG
jgi:hypothetical protein